MGASALRKEAYRDTLQILNKFLQTVSFIYASKQNQLFRYMTVGHNFVLPIFFYVPHPQVYSYQNRLFTIDIRLCIALSYNVRLTGLIFDTFQLILSDTNPKDTKMRLQMIAYYI